MHHHKHCYQKQSDEHIYRLCEQSKQLHCFHNILILRLKINQLLLHISFFICDNILVRLNVSAEIFIFFEWNLRKLYHVWEWIFFCIFDYRSQIRMSFGKNRPRLLARNIRDRNPRKTIFGARQKFLWANLRIIVSFLKTDRHRDFIVHRGNKSFRRMHDQKQNIYEKNE